MEINEKIFYGSVWGVLVYGYSVFFKGLLFYNTPFCTLLKYELVCFNKNKYKHNLHNYSVTKKNIILKIVDEKLSQKFSINKQKLFE